ncbi:hypothetical protein E2542_SST10913 [Spatholobus suberectus]|nr:hypothetical protein E2542_SST10913 [Spatholobus suberectus]
MADCATIWRYGDLRGGDWICVACACLFARSVCNELNTLFSKNVYENLRIAISIRIIGIDGGVVMSLELPLSGSSCGESGISIALA